MVKLHKASIVIPIYNEIQSVKQEVETLFKYEWLSDFELILVDDGSEDGTSDVLTALEKEYDFILVKHEKNQGYGAALKSGIEKASRDHIIITDCDDSYPNDRIPDMLKQYTEKKLDMLVGSRDGNSDAIPTIRKPVKLFFNKLASYLAKRKIPDLNSGLRVFRKDVVMKYKEYLCDGFSFTSTITLIMFCNSYKVDYTPIDYYHRGGKSKIKPVRDTLNFLYLVTSTVFYFRPLRILLPISGTMVLAAMMLLLNDLVQYQSVRTSTGIVFQTGVLTFFMAFIADLLVKKDL